MFILLLLLTLNCSAAEQYAALNQTEQDLSYQSAPSSDAEERILSILALSRYFGGYFYDVEDEVIPHLQPKMHDFMQSKKLEDQHALQVLQTMKVLNTPASKPLPASVQMMVVESLKDSLRHKTREVHQTKAERDQEKVKTRRTAWAHIGTAVLSAALSALTLYVSHCNKS